MALSSLGSPSTYPSARSMFPSGEASSSQISPGSVGNGIHQVFVLRLVLFFLYILPLGDLINSHGFFQCCLCTMELSPAIQYRISDCLSAISVSTSHHYLTTLNMAKTKLLDCPPKPLFPYVLSFFVDNISLCPIEQACSPGFFFHSSFSFISHVQSIAKFCCFFLCNISRLKPFLTVALVKFLF